MTLVAKKTHIKFLALARDCADTLPVLFTLMRDLEGRGCIASAIIGENGSRDGTRATLQQAAQNSRLEIVDTGFMSRIPDRLERMARGRERLKDIAQRQEADYICVIDVDTVLSKPVQADLFLSMIKELAETKSVFGVCAASIPVFYDILALRLQRGVLNEADMLQHFILTRNKSKPLRNYIKKLSMIETCYRRQEDIGTGAGRIFLSAFNGLCLYRASDYCTGTYIGDFRMCEHVTMNESLANHCGSGILVSRFLQLDAPGEHTRMSKWQIISGSLNRLSKSILYREKH